MGDFSAQFKRPDSGIHTVEGNVAGSRAASLTKQRTADQDAYKERKRQIQAESRKGRQSMDEKFNSNTHLSVAERVFREQTVGLVTAEDFKKAQATSNEMAKRKREGLDDEEGNNGSLDSNGIKKEDSMTNEERKKAEKRKLKERKKAKKKRKHLLSTLSFAGAEDADGIVDDEPETDIAQPDNQPNSISTLDTSVKKNPHVDTSFLPDKEREATILQERQRLRSEWMTRQEETKKEKLEITYSYWDGSGHRRTVTCHKGDSIADFLELVRKALAKEFREMQSVTSDALIYVKEDLIIPQDISFYDLIVTKARGKSGPLFNFDVHEDVRVGAIDSRVEKDESHPGKVVERRWYERNKHIFPASRWEVFDPAKDYGGYTIHGGVVNTGKKKG